MQYRKEIDGLRALAVLPVILYHAGFSWLPGGFLGVDVFFVLSGYLISRILMVELAADTFSLRHFYARRARRILPALFTVLLVCVPAAWLWLLPAQYTDFSRSLLAVLLFVPNLFFWRESGYFAADASEMPLLHTWSLGVEEQFYLLFPLVLLLLWRWGRKSVLLGLLLTSVVSLGISEYASYHYPNANFFLLPMRAWELCMGALCASIHHQNATRKNEVLAVVGLCMLLVAFTHFSETMRLPSAYSLLPVVGTMLLVLYARADTWVGRVLSLPPLVGIGLISYSAYLWHYPLFAFAKVQFPEGLGAPLLWGMAVLSLMLAALSWVCIEQPFRKKQHRFYVADKPALLLGLGVALLLLVAALYGRSTGAQQSYWQSMASPAQQKAFALMTQAKEASHLHDNGDCVFRVEALDAATQQRLQQCQQKYGAGLALLGDSHAMDLFFVLKPQLDKAQMRFVADFSQAKCRPHTPAPGCVYEGLQAFLAQQQPRQMFSHILYEQSGAHLFMDAAGNETDRRWFQNVPLYKPMPQIPIHTAHIAAVLRYLSGLQPYAQVVWLGPRLEPQIRETAVVQLGCDYPFSLRPGQEALFAALDHAIIQAAQKAAVPYRSQMALMHFSMQQDFMDCTQLYWSDGDHYSTEGEARFAARITLEKLLAP